MGSQSAKRVKHPEMSQVDQQPGVNRSWNYSQLYDGRPGTTQQSKRTSIHSIARKWILLNIFTKSIKQTLVRKNKHSNFQNRGVGGRIPLATLREKVAIIVACLRDITEPLLILVQSTKCITFTRSDWMWASKFASFSSKTKYNRIFCIV